MSNDRTSAKSLSNRNSDQETHSLGSESIPLHRSGSSHYRAKPHTKHFQPSDFGSRTAEDYQRQEKTREQTRKQSVARERKRQQEWKQVHQKIGQCRTYIGNYWSWICRTLSNPCDADKSVMNDDFSFISLGINFIFTLLAVLMILEHGVYIVNRIFAKMLNITGNLNDNGSKLVLVQNQPFFNALLITVISYAVYLICGFIANHMSSAKGESLSAYPFTVKLSIHTNSALIFSLLALITSFLGLYDIAIISITVMAVIYTTGLTYMIAKRSDSSKLIYIIALTTIIPLFISLLTIRWVIG